MKLLTWLLIIGIVGILMMLGCSASSNSVRFTSHESKTSVVPDSSNIDEISDDNDSEELPNETQSIDISSIMQKIGTSKDSKNLPVSNSLKEKMLMEIIKYLDTPYKYGGNSKNGIDCSAFTQAIFQNTFSVILL